MKKVELLSPAGNIESLIQAINHGADAIYLGLSAFNARGNIDNFNADGLCECVEKAHLFGVKVFLTLNTLVLDSEIEEVLTLVRAAIKAQVDAFIIQDLGLAYLLKNKFPNIELHASTQMGVSNLEGAQFLSKLGFKRVVLARETPLEEIKRIKENLDIEIEYFVQGALCVSFSGNCYLCSLLADASGNRGKCKQFCRLPFTCQSGKDRKEGYLLSTKDFCMLPKLADLANAGVDSFKIEGRARRPAYVAGAVKVYREAIDNNYKINPNSIEILKRLFNRGDFIQGYFNHENIIYNKTQNHMGIEIGKVLSINKGRRFNEVKIYSKHQLERGDSLKFFVDDKEICSLNVQDVKKIDKNQFVFTTTAKVPHNSIVHLIVDSKLEEELLNDTRKIDFKAKFFGEIGKRAKLILVAGNVEIEVESDYVLEEAKLSSFSKEECYDQLQKTGNEFKLVSLEFNSENIFMAKSQINALRRKAIQTLKEKIIQTNQKDVQITEKEFSIKIKKNPQNNIDILYFSSLSLLEKYIKSDDLLVYDPDEYNLVEIENFCNKYANKIIYLNLPIISNQNMIENLKALYKKVENLGVVATNYYAFSITTHDKTIVGSDMNVANSFTIEFYQNLGYNRIILSKENFNFDEIKNGEVKLFIETNFSKNLMYFRHCPFKDNFNSKCDNCKYKEGAVYNLNEKRFALVRKRLGFCQFLLKEIKPSGAREYNFGNVNEIKK